MLHVSLIRCVTALVLLASCGDTASDDSLLSASRIALTERETARVHVDVASVGDLEIDAAPGLTIETTTDAFGVAFDVTATCAAGPAADADLIVHVRDRGSNRTAALVVAVTDDDSDACAAAISIWLDSPDMPCSAVPPAPQTKLVLAREMNAHLCAHAVALDPARPLTAPQLAIEPATGAFNAEQGSGDTQSMLITGARWLVGPYQATFSADIGGTPIVRNVVLEIGAHEDVGIEIMSALDSAGASEFARTTRSVTVHRFPDTTPTCTIALDDPSQGATSCSARNVKLYEANGTGHNLCEPVGCSASPHAEFTLSYVPGIDSLPTELLPIVVSTPNVIEGASAEVSVRSRAENFDCAAATQLACADLGGTITVVASGPGGTCVLTLDPMWRIASQVTIGNAKTMLAIETTTGRKIISLDAGVGGTRVLANQSWISLNWTFEVPASSLPIRSTNAGPPDYLVGIIPNTTTLQFSSVEGTLLGQRALAGIPTNMSYELGVVQAGGTGQDVALIASDQTIYVFTLDWSGILTDGGAPIPTLYAQGSAPNMPAAATRTLAGRALTGTALPDDLLVSYFASPYSSGVAEFSLQTIPLAPALQYGTTRSLASVPDGSVLLGDAGGARQTRFEQVPVPRIRYDPIDPTPPLVPSETYGASIAACAGTSAYVIQTGRDVSGVVHFRVAQLGIEPETP